MDTQGFNPDMVLEHNERAAIAQTVGTPGYRIIHRLHRSMVDKFIVSLMNVSEEDEAAIIAKHKLAKAAAVFFQMSTDRVNHEVQQYTASVKAGGPPIDPTEGYIDLGPAPSTYNDMEHDEQFASEGEDSF